MKLVSVPDSNGQQVVINAEAISTVKPASTKNPDEVTVVTMLNGEKIYLAIDVPAATKKLK